MVTVSKKSFQGWENCISLSNGIVELIVTTDVGPRIISYTINGGANQMAVFPSTAGKTGGNEFVSYGGHRLWHAPEDAVRTNQPDNSTVKYKIVDGGVILHAKTEKETKLAKSMRIIMEDDGTVIIDHRITNHYLFDVDLALWGLTMFDVGGTLAVPTSNHDTDLWANRMVAVWPYCSMNDERVYWGNKFTTVKQKDIENAFKFGTSCHRGWAAYFNHNNLVIKEFPYYDNAVYPNYDCNFESYTNNRFIEIESLTPLLTIEPEESEEYSEIWHIYDNVAEPDMRDEDDIEQKVNVFTDIYDNDYDDTEEDYDEECEDDEDECCCCSHDNGQW